MARGISTAQLAAFILNSNFLASHNLEIGRISIKTGMICLCVCMCVGVVCCVFNTTVKVFITMTGLFSISEIVPNSLSSSVTATCPNLVTC